MAKPDTSRIDSLEAIMADKRKHESYLAKLEEKRASTPAHVFNRLRDEYITKLTDLQVRAAMEAESLSEGLKADEAAVAEIEARLAAVTEERIEGELRAEVGEYDPKDWGKKLEALNASIAKIEQERSTKVAAFERTRALLVEARGAATPVEPPPPAVPAAPEPVAAPVVTAPTAAPTAAPAAAAPVAPRVSAPTPGRPSEIPPSPAPPPPPVRQTPMGQPAPAAAAAPVIEAPSVPAPAAPPPAPAAPAAAEPPRVSTPPKGQPLAGSPSFDELAFLNSVVGRNSAQVKADDAAPAANAPRVSGDARPMNTPAPVPPVAPPAPRSTTNTRPTQGDETSSGPLGRPTPRTSQAIKTLKCQECGTLNYPTEWYCERCGGELAAL